MTTQSASDEYVRVLDGLARFYDAQIVSHVGYFLTSIIAYVSIFALVSTWITASLSGPAPAYYSVLMLLSFIVLGLVYLRLRYRFMPTYFLGRLQYYIVLSEAVRNHLPYSTNDTSGFWYKTLHDRAILLGIPIAVLRLFEARLYLSCVRGIDGIEDYDLSCSDEEQEIFSLSEVYENKKHGLSSYENDWLIQVGKFRFWSKIDLLILAYRRNMIRQYKENPGHTNQEIWELFKPYFNS